MNSTTTWGGASILLAASLGLATACGSSEGPVLSAAGPGGDDSGPSFLVGDASPAAAFDADIERNHVAVTFVALGCSGDCGTVEAVGTGGYPPYTYEWENGSRGATRQICPAATTNYSVTVTDTGMSGELTRPAQTAKAHVTADVLECPDGGAPDDAGSLTDGAVTCVPAGAPLLSGCETVTLLQTQMQECPPLATTGGEVTCLPNPLAAGQAYSVVMTLDGIDMLGGDPEAAVVSGAQADCGGPAGARVADHQLGNSRLAQRARVRPVGQRFPRPRL